MFLILKKRLQPFLIQVLKNLLHQMYFIKSNIIDLLDFYLIYNLLFSNNLLNL